MKLKILNFGLLFYLTFNGFLILKLIDFSIKKGIMKANLVCLFDIYFNSAIIQFTNYIKF